MPDETTPPPPSEPTGPAPPAPSEPEEWSTKYKYLLADFENFRRRVERERESIGRQARGALLREILPILEAFRGARASVADRPADDPVRHGLELLDREWSTFLKREGVTPVAVVGEPFRPEEGEAVGEVAAGEGVPVGAVAEIVQQGYRFYGGLLRPAKVIVATAAGTPPDPGEATRA